MTDNGAGNGLAAVLTIHDVVDGICREFVDEWDSGRDPEISPFLERLPEEAKSSLLSNLVELDVAKRRERGEQPGSDQYITRFPKLETVIRQVFLDATTSVKLGPNAGEKGPHAPCERRVVVAKRLGEYRLVREIGRGGMGVVFEAVHAVTRDRVALKTLPEADAAALLRFKREFRSVAELNHPNLVGLHRLEADGPQWFFTMDFVEGADFLGHVRPGGALDEARLREALTQLIVGVMALHGAGTVHRDLKPSNVLVTPAGRVVILDFGLAVGLRRSTDTATGDWTAGTPAYMAPEQVEGVSVTAAADWYALGVMIFEALSGALPFSGSAFRVLRDKQMNHAPPVPRGRDTPTDLADLCDRLLRSDPAARPDAMELARALSAQAKSLAATATDAEDRLIGREDQSLALRESLSRLERQTGPITVFVRGLSGEGKTSLVENSLAPLRKSNRFTVLSGRCYDRESVPFKSIDNLIDALSSLLRSMPETEAALLIPNDMSILAELFPVLRRVDVVSKARRIRVAELDEQQIRRRAFDALRELLQRLSDRRPVIMFIDDIQWGDADGAAAMFGVLQPPEAPSILFVATYRSDEAEASPFLAKWRDLERTLGVGIEVREVTVGPLSDEQSVELVVSRTGRDDERTRRRAIEMSRASGGNPLLLTELASCFDPDSDTFSPMPMDEVIASKLRRLPDAALDLLRVIAVYGQAVSIEDAAKAAEQASGLTSTLTHMRNERLIRLISAGDEARVDTYHDKIRESVLDRMEVDDRRRMHARLGEVIEVSLGLDSERIALDVEEGRTEARLENASIQKLLDLSYHFDAAQSSKKAWIYSLLGAEQAGRQYAIAAAADLYAAAGRNASNVPTAVRFRLDRGWGEILVHVSRYREADERLQAAMALAETDEARAGVELLQGQAAMRQGLVRESAARFESGLRRLGLKVPRSGFGLAAQIVRSVFVQCIHGFFPRSVGTRALDKRGMMVVDLLTSSLHPYIFSNTPRLFWSQLEQLNRAERSKNEIQVGKSHAMHSCLASMLGWSDRGVRFAERSLNLISKHNDLVALGYSLGYQGIGHYAAARFSESEARLNEASELFRKAGDHYEYHLVQFHKGCSRFGLGDLTGALEIARENFESSARMGDSRILCSSYLWARIKRGDVPFEQLRGCFPNRPDDVMSTVHGIMAEGHWHTFHQRTEDALAAFERAGTMVRTSLCLNSHTILTLPNLAAASRRHAEAVGERDPKLRDRLMRRADKLSGWAATITRFFPAAYPFSLRERALTLESLGRFKKALAVADRSLIVADRQEARYEYAESLLVRGRLAVRLGRSEGEAQVREAEARLGEIRKGS